MLNALSVDVEDWFQAGAFEAVIGRDRWDGLPLRVERNCEAILSLFDRAKVKGTFFTLGWMAERCPELVRRIAGSGHEVASRGWDRRPVFTLDDATFRADLRRASDAIEAACGRAPIGYRAPDASIDGRTPWAHRVLAEEGYFYSSSIAPVGHYQSSEPKTSRFIHRPLGDAALVEIPITTVEWGGHRLPAGGGDVFRLLPYRFTNWAIERVNHHDQRPAIFYFRPWEIDRHQPRVDGAPLRTRLCHYGGLSEMEGKLMKLLKSFRWGRMDAVVASEAAWLY